MRMEKRQKEDTERLKDSAKEKMTERCRQKKKGRRPQAGQKSLRRAVGHMEAEGAESEIEK